MEKRIDLVDASARLRVPYHTAHRWALVGKLDGERRDGRWTVSVSSLERLERQRAASRPEALAV